MAVTDGRAPLRGRLGAGRRECGGEEPEGGHDGNGVAPPRLGRGRVPPRGGPQSVLGSKEVETDTTARNESIGFSRIHLQIQMKSCQIINLSKHHGIKKLTDPKRNFHKAIDD
ncbi:hypothetical protein [Methylobacterium sp. SyP6R]|uniref:hypothetical protein n=1 Tax=Methylobacterium sp. SyP6R TaxID=2718876 RepID=UPI001F228250|nr:hypothetical protein [Methylobacterium sp. SyP6R]MCF4129957.1 hypothetical protein [Methylobacterium sp. SyP6R]